MPILCGSSVIAQPHAFLVTSSPEPQIIRPLPSVSPSASAPPPSPSPGRGPSIRRSSQPTRLSTAPAAAASTPAGVPSSPSSTTQQTASRMNASCSETSPNSPVARSLQPTTTKQRHLHHRPPPLLPPFMPLRCLQKLPARRRKHSTNNRLQTIAAVKVKTLVTTAVPLVSIRVPVTSWMQRRERGVVLAP